LCLESVSVNPDKWRGPARSLQYRISCPKVRRQITSRFCGLIARRARRSDRAHSEAAVISPDRDSKQAF